MTTETKLPQPGEYWLTRGGERRYVVDIGDPIEPWLPEPVKWRPSIFMPRWASRSTLEITGVRVERLQEISEEDAKAEGAPYWVTGHGPVTDAEIMVEPGYIGAGSHREGFEMLWYDINGRESWAANPFVWVVEFRKES